MTTFKPHPKSEPKPTSETYREAFRNLYGYDAPYDEETRKVCEELDYQAEQSEPRQLDPMVELLITAFRATFEPDRPPYDDEQDGLGGGGGSYDNGSPGTH